MQEVFFDIGHATLHAPFFIRLIHATGPDLKAIMIGEIQIPRVKHDRVESPVQDSHFAVVDPDLACDPSKIFKGVLVTGKKMFHGFSQRELQIHFATVSQHHEKEGEPSAGGTHGHRTGVSPVHLSTLPRFKMKGQESRFGFGAHLADKIFDDRIASAIAAFLDLLENLAGRIIVAFQKTDDLSFKWIEFAFSFWWWRFLKILPLGPFSNGLQIELEFPRDLPKGEFLFRVKMPDLA